jgi:hypothetical protein
LGLDWIGSDQMMGRSSVGVGGCFVSFVVVDGRIWMLPTVQDDGDFLAVARCEDVVEEG